MPPGAAQAGPAIFVAHETFPHQSRPSNSNVARNFFHTPHGTRNSPLLAVNPGPPVPYAPPAQTSLPPPSGPCATLANPLYTKHQAERATAMWAPPITPQSHARVPSSSPFLRARRQKRRRKTPNYAHTIIPTAAPAPPLGRRRAAAEELSVEWLSLVWEALPNFSDRVVVAVCRRE